jgi:hypothetical protein
VGGIYYRQIDMKPFLNKEEMRKRTALIVEYLKVNQSLLDGCLGPHVFSICVDKVERTVVKAPEKFQLLDAYWRCEKCGGDISGDAKTWYNKGLEDAHKVKTGVWY